MSTYSPEFIRAIPKTDLHVHLDGSLRIPTLIELAQERGVELPADDEAGLRREVFRDHYANLGEYLHGFKYTCAVLRDPVALERCAFEMADDAFAEGVRYMEVRFAPQLHVTEEMSLEQTLVAVTAGLRRAEATWNTAPGVVAGTEPPFRCGIIVCAMRFFTAGFSPFFASYVEAHAYRDLKEIIVLASEDLARAAVAIRDRLGIPIVGFDLAGQEDGYPAGPHRAAYAFAHRHFMSKTVHAGEAFGPESIFQAITELHADRIGHGFHIFSHEKVTSPDIADPQAYCDALAQYIADRRITVEVCLTSNLQTNPEIGAIANHTFGRMIDARLSVTLCTDNRLVSNTTVSKEYELAVANFNLTPERLRHLTIYGFKRSFYTGSYLDKRHYVRQVIDYYESCERDFSVSG
ncbi:MAG: adenosine deaminase family protein [Myxococcales bacterium]|nr:adenosine deaminase family protein [Myxococcales bacterium]